MGFFFIFMRGLPLYELKQRRHGLNRDGGEEDGKKWEESEEKMLSECKIDKQIFLKGIFPPES